MRFLLSIFFELFKLTQNEYNICKAGFVIAIVGLRECQGQSSYYDQENSYGRYSQGSRRGNPDRFRDRDSLTPEDYEAMSINKWGSGGDRNDRYSNCRRTIDGFETGFCNRIPDDRDLERVEDKDALSADITEFALQLFKASNKPHVGNMVLSGLSPQVLLSYLSWTGEGDTREQMKKAKVLSSPKQIQKMVSSMLGSSEKREMNIATAFFTSPDIV